MWNNFSFSSGDTGLTERHETMLENQPEHHAYPFRGRGTRFRPM